MYMMWVLKCSSGNLVPTLVARQTNIPELLPVVSPKEMLNLAHTKSCTSCVVKEVHNAFKVTDITSLTHDKDKSHDLKTLQR